MKPVVETNKYNTVNSWTKMSSISILGTFLFLWKKNICLTMVVLLHYYTIQTLKSEAVNIFIVYTANYEKSVMYLSCISYYNNSPLDVRLCQSASQSVNVFYHRFTIVSHLLAQSREHPGLTASLGCGTKQENAKEIHTWTGRTCQLLTERHPLSWPLTPGIKAFLLWGTGLTTSPHPPHNLCSFNFSFYFTLLGLVQRLVTFQTNKM